MNAWIGDAELLHVAGAVSAAGPSPVAGAECSAGPQHVDRVTEPREMIMDKWVEKWMRFQAS